MWYISVLFRQDHWSLGSLVLHCTGACNEVWTMQNVDIKCLSWVRPPAPVTRRHTSVNHTRTNLSPAPPPCTWTIQLGWLSISLCPGKYRNFWWFHLRHVIICHNASKQLKCLLEHQQSEIIIRFSNKLGLRFIYVDISKQGISILWVNLYSDIIWSMQIISLLWVDLSCGCVGCLHVSLSK